MVLEYWWVILIWLSVITAAITVGLLLRAKSSTKKQLFFANTERLTQTEPYVKALTTYRRSIGGLLILTIVAGLSSSVIASKPVDIKVENPVKYNRDVVLCLDVSGSMVEVNLLILSKFDELVEGFKGERIGLVVFNSVSNQVFPLTDDYAYIKEQLELVRIGLNGDYQNGYDVITYTVNSEGSSLIGDGLAACTFSFDNSDNETRSRSIILATDNIVAGEELITLDDAATLASKDNINVYGINPEFDVAPLEAENMRRDLESNGGKYYSLNDLATVSNIIDRIEEDETSAIQGDAILSKTDNPQVWIIALLVSVILLLGFALRFKV